MIEDVHLATAAGGIVAFLLQHQLAQLVTVRQVHHLDDAHEQRHRIVRQFLDGDGIEALRIEALAPCHHDCGHPRPALLARHLYAVHIDEFRGGISRKLLDDLGGRYVFGFPTESVTDAIDKMAIAVLVEAQ